MQMDSCHYDREEGRLRPRHSSSGGRLPKGNFVGPAAAAKVGEDRILAYFFLSLELLVPLNVSQDFLHPPFKLFLSLSFQWVIFLNRQLGFSEI